MIKKSLSFLLLAFALNIALFSCKKPDERPAPPQAEQEYFPLEVGKWVIYDVDSTIWDDTFCVERFYNYQVRLSVADTFTDDLGRPSYRIDRSIRRKTGDEWRPQEVIYATNTGISLEIVQDELRTIKMTFPIANGEEWEGNNYILSDDPRFDFYADWVYHYELYKERFNSGFKVFDNTVTVVQIDTAVADPEVFPEEYASRTKSNEVYASGVGMVYREYIRWTYDPATTKCRKGVGVVMRAMDHN